MSFLYEIGSGLELESILSDTRIGQNLNSQDFDDIYAGLNEQLDSETNPNFEFISYVSLKKDFVIVKGNEMKIGASIIKSLFDIGFEDSDVDGLSLEDLKEFLSENTVIIVDKGDLFMYLNPLVS